MLDVHIAISLDTPFEWVMRCLDSVHKAIDRAGFPVERFTVPGVPGHIGKARATGYAQGTGEYVTSVDDDDWLEPDAFRCLAAALARKPAAIYTRETTWQNGKPGKFDGRQNLRVFRRDVLAGVNLDEWPCLDSTAMIAHATSMGECIDLPDRVYNYRIDPQSKARKLMAEHPDVVARARAMGNGHD